MTLVVGLVYWVGHVAGSPSSFWLHFVGAALIGARPLLVPLDRFRLGGRLGRRRSCCLSRVRRRSGRAGRCSGRSASCRDDPLRHGIATGVRGRIRRRRGQECTSTADSSRRQVWTESAGWAPTVALGVSASSSCCLACSASQNGRDVAAGTEAPERTLVTFGVWRGRSGSGFSPCRETCASTRPCCGGWAPSVEVRLPEQLDGLDGLVIPGGESTAIGAALRLYGLDEALPAFGGADPRHLRGDDRARPASISGSADIRVAAQRLRPPGARASRPTSTSATATSRCAASSSARRGSRTPGRTSRCWPRSTAIRCSRARAAPRRRVPPGADGRHAGATSCFLRQSVREGSHVGA